MTERQLDAVVDNLRAAQEDLEGLADFLEAIRSGELRIIRECMVHGSHHGFIPEQEVTHVDFKVLGEGDQKVHLQCGHVVVLPKDLRTARGDVQPCMICANECEWQSELGLPI